MKRKAFIAVLALTLALTAVPLTAAASSVSSNILAVTAQDVKSSDSNGVVRTIDEDFAYSPIGKPKSPTKMKTAPPPVSAGEQANARSVSILSSNTYLIDGYAYIGINSSGKISMLGTTTASQVVDKITGQLALYRYDGSTWIEYSSFPAQSKASASSLTLTRSGLTLNKGYYYETNYFTYLKQGNLIEAEDYYSGAVNHD